MKKFENIMPIITITAAAKNMTVEEVINRLNFEAMMNNHLNVNGVEVKVEDMDVEAIETDTETVVKHPGTYLAMMEELDEYMWGLFHDSYDLAYIPSKGWVKRQTRRGHIIKDKAKAGYHHPRRWEGREYNRGEVEKLRAEAVIKANKLQMLSENEDDENTINEAVGFLWAIYENDITKKLHQLRVNRYYHSPSWYTTSRIEEAVNEARNLWNEFQQMEVEFYSSIDSIYPEEGMGWRNEVVSVFMDDLYRNVKTALALAVSHVKLCIKERIEMEIQKLTEEKNNLHRYEKVDF